MTLLIESRMFCDEESSELFKSYISNINSITEGENALGYYRMVRIHIIDIIFPE